MTKLKVHVDGVLDGLAAALRPEAVKLDVQDVATGDDARGPAWSRRTVTVKVRNVDELVAAVEPPGISGDDIVISQIAREDGLCANVPE